MIKEIKIPDIGENVESGQVVKVLVSEGDKIEKDQALIELETDKAVVEIPSTMSGTIKEMTVSEDDSVEIGDVIAKIEVSDEEAEEGEEEAKPREKEAEEKEEKPSEDEEKEDEEEDEEEEEEEEEEESKEKEKEKKKAKAKKEKEKKEKKEKTKKQEAKKEKKETEEAKEEEKPEVKEEVAPAAPSVRRLARELGIDIDEVTGTGPGGRITDDDLKEHAREIIATKDTSKPKKSKPGKIELPDFSKWGEIEKKNISQVRNITAKSVSQAWNIIPHVTQFDEADISNLEKFIDKFSKKVEKAGGKLTVTAPIMKIITAALQKFPRFNASLDLDNGTIIYKKYYHIGLAVATERGLLVPVIRDVHKKGIMDLAVEIAEIAEKTRDKKIKPDEMEGGTFTISNQGGIGGTNFTPIVFWPQAAILGISRAQTRPVMMDNRRAKAKKILPLSLSYDHRIVDGADAAGFLRWVSDAIENPYLVNFED